MVRSEGNAGQIVPIRFPLGADAVKAMQEECDKEKATCEVREDFTSDTHFRATSDPVCS